MRPSDRTVDQMVQAARSGKQNIAEGSLASATYKEMEIKLIGVARASMAELLIDYQDYLRTNGLVTWPKDSKEATFARDLGNNYAAYRPFAETRPAEVVANLAICTIHQANFLLDQLLRRLEHDFVKAGGLKERMFNARLAERNGKAPRSYNGESPH